MKVKIIYWSGTGNTEDMARLIEEGLKDKTDDVELIEVSNAEKSHVEEADLVFLGSPSMGSEVIEEQYMEPFVESISDIVKGKRIGLFGSYGWGTGEWMEDWVARMKSLGAEILGEGLIVNYSPEGEEELCREYGRSI